jgi:hypothetical protein
MLTGNWPRGKQGTTARRPARSRARVEPGSVCIWRSGAETSAWSLVPRLTVSSRLGGSCRKSSDCSGADHSYPPKARRRALGLVANQARQLRMRRVVGGRRVRRTVWRPSTKRAARHRTAKRAGKPARTKRAARHRTAKPAAKRPRTRLAIGLTTVARRTEHGRRPRKDTPFTEHAQSLWARILVPFASAIAASANDVVAGDPATLKGAKTIV